MERYALKTKWKCKRSEYPDNIAIQEYQVKYSRSGSGHSIKRKRDETAQNDRCKQVNYNWIFFVTLSFFKMITIPYNDEISHDIQSKADQLRD